jgi:hypothetical protein
MQSTKFDEAFGMLCHGDLPMVDNGGVASGFRGVT